ncbi:MAG: hypothetical protein AB8B49_00635 [Nitratireductor sp.]
MLLVQKFLHLLATNGRMVLIAGLVVGMLWLDLAIFLKPYIPEFAFGLLFLASFRVGPKAAIGAVKDMRLAIVMVLVLQILVPVGLFLVFKLVGWNTMLAYTIVLLMGGAALSATPHLTVMVGHEPAPALRQLVLGTALLPLTIFPVIWLMPQFGDFQSILMPSIKLFLVIGTSALLAFALRHFRFSNLDESAMQNVFKTVDGMSSIILFLIVIGLMSAVAPALYNDTRAFYITLLAAFAVNFGLQILFYVLLQSPKLSGVRVATSIAAGNRNMALFLTALPASVTDPMLLFIGCYQIPMYLTPVLLKKLYMRTKS